MLILGESDEFTSVRSFEEFCNTLQSARAIVPNAGHFYVHNTEMVRLLESVVIFLSKL